MSATMVEIVIKGTLSDALGPLLEGFSVSRVEHGRTHLIGPILDQARLQGILTLLASFNIELISVNPVESGDPIE